MDLNEEEQLGLLSKTAKFKELVRGRDWESQLTRLPNKIALIPYREGQKMKARIKVYFASHDQDFKDMFVKRNELRKKSRTIEENQAVSLGSK